MPRYIVIVNERRRVSYATEAESEEEAVGNILSRGLAADPEEDEFIEFCGEEPYAYLDDHCPDCQNNTECCICEGENDPAEDQDR